MAGHRPDRGPLPDGRPSRSPVIIPIIPAGWR